MARAAFAVYALALVTATHWPALVIASHGVTRLDLYIHACAFGCWAALFTLSGFFGRALSPRNIGWSALAAVAYALVDELSQGIPVLQRTVDPTDLAANTAGIALAALTLAGWARARERRPRRVSADRSSGR